jgi:F-type H+-transporting ATPase subunit delta
MTTKASAAAALLSEDDAEAVRQYAAALLGAAEKEGKVEEALDDLDAIRVEILDANPEFASLLAAPQMAAEEKDRVLVELFDGRVSDVTLRFLRVLNRHGRLGIVGPLSQEARKVWDRRHGRVPVYVKTASPLDADQEAALVKKLAAMIAATPILHVSTDPELIGGLVVQVGDQVCDASVRTRLEQVRQRLIEGKMYEIQKRRDQFSHPA